MTLNWALITQRGKTDELSSKPRKAEIKTVNATPARGFVFVGRCPMAMLLSFAGRDDRQTTRCEALATVLAWMSPVAPCRLRRRGLSQGSSRGNYLFQWFIL